MAVDGAYPEPPRHPCPYAVIVNRRAKFERRSGVNFQDQLTPNIVSAVADQCLRVAIGFTLAIEGLMEREFGKKDHRQGSVRPGHWRSHGRAPAPG
jgi:hypothetical protein